MTTSTADNHDHKHLSTRVNKALVLYGGMSIPLLMVIDKILHIFGICIGG